LSKKQYKFYYYILAKKQVLTWSSFCSFNCAKIWKY